jgi:hypothetical protein
LKNISIGASTMGEVLDFNACRSPGAIADGRDGPDRGGIRYLGYRAAGRVSVFREDRDGHLASLAMRNDLRNHSPTGPEWGYSGSGPAQLALAILSDAIGEHEALGHYQDFQSAVVSGLPHDRWALSRADVLAWHEEHRRDTTRAEPPLPSPGAIAEGRDGPDSQDPQRGKGHGR